MGMRFAFPDPPVDAAKKIQLLGMGETATGQMLWTPFCLSSKITMCSQRKQI